jgi:two-component system, LytTR family, sensor kinase
VKLSELLRYSLYETNQEMVSLKSEIEYLKNYVELEKIRLEDGVKIEFSSPDLSNSSYTIAPLLLMVFVENAFKHARSVNESGMEININIKVNSFDYLHFVVENNQSEHPINNEYVNQKGIGLLNVSKRLDALYPNNLHQLKINESGNKYSVSLILKLYTSSK